MLGVWDFALTPEDLAARETGEYLWRARAEQRYRPGGAGRRHSQRWPWRRPTRDHLYNADGRSGHDDANFAWIRDVAFPTGVKRWVATRMAARSSVFIGAGDSDKVGAALREFISVCSRCTQNTSWYLNWYSPPFPGKSRQQRNLMEQFSKMASFAYKSHAPVNIHTDQVKLHGTLELLQFPS